MKPWIVRALLVVFLVTGLAACDGAKDDHKDHDHKGHEHKPGEKH